MRSLHDDRALWIACFVSRHLIGTPVEQSLSGFPDPEQIEDNGTLAVACLALDYQRALVAFGVTE